MKSLKESIYNRRSPRSFSSAQIPEEIINQLFDAARWAPSSMNEQPWLYLFAYNGTDKFDKILESLVPFNKQWAKNASVLVVSMARKNSLYNGKPNKYYLYDTGSANQNLLLAAFDYDIYGHPMGGFDSETLIKNFNIPNDIEPVTVIALGYLDSPHKLPEDLRNREIAQRERRPIKDIIVESF